jgi:formylglycine-generating enzyme required for sulfatase activity
MLRVSYAQTKFREFLGVCGLKVDVSFLRVIRPAKRCVIVTIFFLVVYALPGLAQPRKALTLNNISDLIKSGATPNRIARLVEENGVGFELDDRALQRLKQDGANETVLSAVKKMSARYAEKQQQIKRQQEEARLKREEEVKRRADEEKRSRAEVEREKPSKKPIETLPILSAGEAFRDRLKNGGEGPEMVVVPPGSFRMGSLQGSDFNRPVHGVQIQKPFAIGRYEVTFDEYDQFAIATGRSLPKDGGWGRGRRPVINVSWQDAVEYSKWLSEQTGKRYRLPTEAEWEYAARAGTGTAYWWGNEGWKSGMANCNNCGSQWDNKQTSPVGSFKPNPFGLYDTAGNVYEWVLDLWQYSYLGAPTDGSAWEQKNRDNVGPKRVRRGGSWRSYPEDSRVFHREGVGASDRGHNLGFRLVQDLD